MPNTDMTVWALPLRSRASVGLVARIDYAPTDGRAVSAAERDLTLLDLPASHILHRRAILSSRRSFRRLSETSLFLALLFLESEAISAAVVKIAAQDQRPVIYAESHALLIGVSEYTEGWARLDSVPSEIDKVRAVLQERGFQVEVVLDPSARQLDDAFSDFIDRYGYHRNNRLLFFFSGHGYTRQSKGYLVPSDAPVPYLDELAFLRKALPMTSIVSWARQIEAKHALFLFDSCFSGSIFTARSPPEVPPHILAATARPVRQFITAGSAGESVAAKSIFVPMLTRALQGDADLNSDGFITGTELGLYLHESLLSYRIGQTPQYGKIRDPELNEGDFVFFLDDNKFTPPDARGARLVSLPREMRSSLSFDASDSAGLFVGVRSFEDGDFPEVPYAVDDAVDLANLFVFELDLISPAKATLALAGEPQKEESRKFLQKLKQKGARIEDAGQSDIYRLLNEQRKATAPGGIFLVSFATHGYSADGIQFLATTDSLASRIKRTGIAMNEVFDEVARAKTRKLIVLIDACRERLLGNARAGGVDPNSAMGEAFVNAMAAATGQVVLSGATLGGYTYDDNVRRNGVFTAAVIDGLLGGADANEQGLITVDNLARFVNWQVQAWVDENRPDHSAVSGDIEVRLGGAAGRMPLAVDLKAQEAVQKSLQQRSEALKLLRRDMDYKGPITGSLVDQLSRVLENFDASHPRSVELLEQVLKLNQTPEMKRNLAWYWTYEWLPHSVEIETVRPGGKNAELWTSTWSHYSSQIGGRTASGTLRLSAYEDNTFAGDFTNEITSPDQGGTLGGEVSADGRLLTGWWVNRLGQSGTLSFELSEGDLHFEGSYSLTGSSSKTSWSGDKIPGRSQLSSARLDPNYTHYIESTCTNKGRRGINIRSKALNRSEIERAKRSVEFSNQTLVGWLDHGTKIVRLETAQGWHTVVTVVSDGVRFGYISSRCDGEPTIGRL